LSVVVVALAAPLRVTVTPVPFVAGLAVPETLNVVRKTGFAEPFAAEKPAQPTLARQDKHTIARTTLAREIFSVT
jgi:hypothetical protein